MKYLCIRLYLDEYEDQWFEHSYGTFCTKEEAEQFGQNLTTDQICSDNPIVETDYIISDLESDA